ncbi:MAG: sigma factor-like helix-turn-helix DNA-binding protein, partial [Sphingobium sp.]
KGFEQRLFHGDALDTAAVIASDEPSAHVHLEAAHELKLVQDAIAQLPERTRTAFMLHRFEGLRLIDIAARLGISKSLAHELVTDGVEQCRKALRRRL